MSDTSKTEIPTPPAPQESDTASPDAFIDSDPIPLERKRFRLKSWKGFLLSVAVVALIVMFAQLLNPSPKQPAPSATAPPSVVEELKQCNQDRETMFKMLREIKQIVY